METSSALIEVTNSIDDVGNVRGNEKFKVTT